MSQVINTNLMALNARRHLDNSTSTLSNTVQRLSSGLRVNSAKDDAAGLAIAERMNTQVRGMTVAIRNANDGISLAQTAEGALGELAGMAQRMRELAVQSLNATNGPGDRANLDAEYQQLSEEIIRTIGNASFNGLKILADDAGPQVFQVGASAEAEDRITVTTQDLSAIFTAANAGDILDVTNAGAALTQLDTFIDETTSQRAVYGAAQNRFESVIANLQVAIENQTAARSRIMDADYAAETAALTRSQILQQAGTAMLAQANQLPNTVLQLLQR